MSQQSYDYANRQGIFPISWDLFHGLCKGLVQAVAPYRPDLILPVGRGGYYPGTLIAQLFQAELYPIRLSRRVRDVITYDQPRWLLKPPKRLVKGRRVLVVDEISSQGETLRLVKQEVEQRGAAAVRCAVLYAHSWGTAVPDYIGLISDALILNPWDREIWKDGAFRFHPEYADALAAQGIDPDPSLLVPAPPVQIAKPAAP